MERHERILVVDDSNVVRRVLTRVLEDLGYTVDSASSGEAAFERCLEQPYDLIITDITMGALSGVQLTRLLRSDPATSDTPIIMLTASDDPRSRFWGRNAGADAYISKDLMTSHLGPAVEQLLRTTPTSKTTATVRLGKRSSPMERLSQVLDNLLFEAVVASEVRRLVHHLASREEFCEEVLALAAEIADYAYLVLDLGGPEPSHAVHARYAWPESPTEEHLAALGIAGLEFSSIQMIVDPESERTDGAITGGDQVAYPIRAGDKQLGLMRVYGGPKRLGGTDRTTLELISREIGLVAQSMFLMEETRHLAHTDGLTGLFNRRRTTEQLENEVSRALRHKTPLSVALCDVDHFKKVNDTYGHNIGDEVLQMVASTLDDAVRNIDVVGRWGGEEFLVVLTNTSAAGSRIVADRLRVILESKKPAGEGPERVTVSVGVACFDGSETAEQLVGRADNALYRAKERGRNRVELDGPEV